MREKVAKAIAESLKSNAVYVSDDLNKCVVDGGLFDMHEIADAAIAAILAELETPSVEMVHYVAHYIGCLEPTDAEKTNVERAIQAVAAHLRKA